MGPAPQRKPPTPQRKPQAPPRRPPVRKKRDPFAPLPRDPNLTPLQNRRRDEQRARDRKNWERQQGIISRIPQRRIERAARKKREERQKRDREVAAILSRPQKKKRQPYTEYRGPETGGSWTSNKPAGWDAKWNARPSKKETYSKPLVGMYVDKKGNNWCQESVLSKGQISRQRA